MDLYACRVPDRLSRATQVSQGNDGKAAPPVPPSSRHVIRIAPQVEWNERFLSGAP